MQYAIRLVLPVVLISVANLDAQTTVTQNRVRCIDCQWRLGPPMHLPPSLPESMFIGRIGGAATTNTGMLYIADLLQHHVLAIDFESGTSRAIGRHGRGPGEFIAPSLIAPTVNGHVFIYDAAQRRVAEFDSVHTFLRSFNLPAGMLTPSSMISDDSQNVYVSSSAIQRPQRGFLIHKFDRNGLWLQSFVEQNGSNSNVEDMGGGLLWWDGATKSLWFSRAGPAFELLQLSPEGVLHRQLRLAIPPVENWRSDSEVTARGNQIRMTPRARLGSVALFPLPARHLANLSVVDETGIIRYDVVNLDNGDYVARWQVPPQPARIAIGDGDFVYAINPFEDPFITRFSVRFP